MRARAPERFGDEAAREMIERAGSVSIRLITFSGNVVIGLLILTVVAGVLLPIFGAASPDPLRFRDEFAIAAHAALPQLLGVLLSVALMRSGLPGFEAPGASPLSLGFLFDEQAQPFLHRLAAQLTLFGAWNVFLLALGNQVKTRGKSLSGPLAIVGGLWLLASLGFAGLSALFTG
jgi:hypothetical protein